MLNRFTKQPHISSESLFEAWDALPKREKLAFLGSLVKVKSLREDLEDLIDIAICEERSKEPTRPLEAVLKKRHRRSHRKKA